MASYPNLDLGCEGDGSEMSKDDYPEHVLEVRELSMPVLLDLLESGPKTVQQVYPEVQRVLGRARCDDSIRCLHTVDGYVSEPEWQHRVRHGLNVLRQEGFCFNTARGRPWVLIGLDQIVLNGQVVPITKSTCFRLKGKVRLCRTPSMKEGSQAVEADTVVSIGSRAPIVMDMQIWLSVALVDGVSPATSLWIRKREIVASSAEWIP
jgi:hypothetical protein